TAENQGMIASAGYYLAMSANSIKAMSPLAVTGSIGVVVAGLDFSGVLAANGIRKIKIVSKNAPNKQADPTTEKGQDIIQAQIDAMERVFINTVAKGRGTTEADVIANFGKGGLLIAKDPGEENPDALSVGMVDSVVIGGDVVEANGEDGPTAFQDLEIVDSPWDEKSAIERVKASGYTKNAFLCYNSAEADGGLLAFTDMVDGKLVANIHGINAAEEQLSRVPEVDRPKVQSHIERYRDKWQQSDGVTGPQSNTASGGNPKKEILMNLKELKAEHPSIFDEAVAIGASQERERVEAHITMGEAASDTAMALENIKSGAELTSAINAKYMASSMNRTDKQNREDDNVDDIDTQSTADVDTKDEKVAKALAEITGVTTDV
ncbi:MAG: S49 family peptidase, partial [Thermodesulfobacteriota bacterium]